MRILFGALLALTVTAAAAAAEEPGQGTFVPPDWLSQPSSEDVEAVWPKDALAKGEGGQTIIECLAVPEGTLKDCKIVSEEPAGQGFGAAALQLTPRFVMKPATRDGKPVASPVRIPIKFQVPDPQFAPDWLKQPDSDDLQAVWPRAALAKGKSGRAVMACEVEPQGTLERCKVVSEKPVGMGFGAAALLLAPSFVMKPATKNGTPIRAQVQIPISFKVEGAMNSASLQEVSMIQEPIWTSAPSFEDMKAAWPAGAKGDVGHVSMRCRLTREGTLHYCDVLTETPSRQGFGKAARTIVASKFRMRIDPAAADKVLKAYVNLAVHFNNPATNTPRAVVEPKWITGPDPAKVQAIYPPKAAESRRRRREVGQGIRRLHGGERRPPGGL